MLHSLNQHYLTLSQTITYQRSPKNSNNRNIRSKQYQTLRRKDVRYSILLSRKDIIIPRIYRSRGYTLTRRTRSAGIKHRQFLELVRKTIDRTLSPRRERGTRPGIKEILRERLLTNRHPLYRLQLFDSSRLYRNSLRSPRIY